MRPDALAQEVARVLAPVIAGLVPDLDAAEIASLLGPPPKPEMGDLAFPCFRLSKPLKQAPPKIAQTLAEALAGQVGRGLIAGLEPAGPYLNLRLVPAEVARIVLPGWARGELPEFPAARGKVMIEFSQPNTHKAFHVGHMRNLCLGDSLVRLLRATGHEVIAANYLGDVGTHVAKCLWGLEALDGVWEGSVLAGGRSGGEALGEVYARAAIQLEDWEKAGKAGDAEAAAHYATARARMTEILLGIEHRQPPHHQRWMETREWSLYDFAEIYAWTDVHFDRVFYESEVDEPGLKLVDEFLAKGVFAESQGAIGIHNPEIKHMPFFMLRKSDGTSLYATKDLALARMKFEEYGIDRSIYVVDARQSDHFKQVFLTLKKMGFAQAERCEHVAYEMVELPEGPMSSRKGNVILFRALREQMAAGLIRHHFEAQRDKLSEAEFDLAIHQVSLGAIKYGMLARDNNQKIVFDMDKWTDVQGGDGGATLQYVAARSASLLRKARERDMVLNPELLEPGASLAGAVFEHPAEQALLQAIAALPGAVAQAAATLRPSMLCSQLYTLTKAYNRFQQECDVIHQTDPDVVQARLLAVTATRAALSWGLSLLGIPAPERM